MMYLSINGEKKKSLKENVNLDDIASWLSNNKDVGFAILFNEGDKIMQWTHFNGWKNIPDYEEPR